MKQISPEKFRARKNKFLFGSTAAIITNLGLVVGLFGSANAKVNIVGSILIIAVADNISDTLGIHIYQEAEGLRNRDVWLFSLTNFMSRLGVSLLFILFVLALPLKTAVACCLVLGLLIISFFSYIIALYKGTKPLYAVLEHLGVAVTVITLSKLLGRFIASRF